MKITKLELENVKRVRAVEITPAQNGITVIGGKNGQGKTSILDAIAWALGGEKYRPSNEKRDGSVIPPRLHVELDNGIIVERSGQSSALKVTDPRGRKGGQALLDEFVEKLALDLPKFMQQNGKEKANTLLRVIGKEQEVKRLEDREAQLYNQRRTIGQIADQKKKYADEMAFYPGMPEEIVSVGELIERQQSILLKNAENQRKRNQLERLLEEQALLNRKLREVEANLEIAMKDAETLQDENTAELEKSINQCDEINRKVRANLDREKAMEDSRQMQNQYDQLSAEIDNVRNERMNLLQGANLPLPGLNVENGELSYNGKAWDCMSGAEQLRVAVAIVRAINPKCGFVLMDKTEQMDTDTLREFGEWLEREGLQAICTRVSTGGECQIIIEDGTVVKDEKQEEKQWKAGTF